MKEKLINNLGIKILSVCLALFLWIVIINVDDPVKTRTFTNVPVQVLNESTLTSKNKAYDIVSGEMVDFTVKGKRSQLDNLKKTDFIATADLAELTPPFDTVKINVECIKNMDLEITMGKVSALTISLEDIIKKSFSIRVVTSGACAPGYASDETEVSPALIEVSGAESVIKDIQEVKVLVDVTGAYSDITRIVEPKAYSERGEIDSSKLRFSNNEVTVKVTILETKRIPVIVETRGEPAYGYQFKEAAFEPQEIEIKGTSAKLKNISSLPVSVDLTGLTEDKEFSISIQDQLEKYGVSTVGNENENIAIKVVIQKLIEKAFNIFPNDIHVTNIEEGLRYEFLAQPQAGYVVRIMGPELELAGITLESLEPSIDLKGFASGKHHVSLKLKVPEGVTVLSVDNIFVHISSILGEEDESDNGDSENEDVPDVPASSQPPVVSTAPPSPTPQPSWPAESEEQQPEQEEGEA